MRTKCAVADVNMELEVPSLEDDEAAGSEDDEKPDPLVSPPPPPSSSLVAPAAAPPPLLQAGDVPQGSVSGKRPRPDQAPAGGEAASDDAPARNALSDRFAQRVCSPPLPHKS